MMSSSRRRRGRGDRTSTAQVIHRQWTLLKMLPKEPQWEDTPTLAERLLREHGIEVPTRTLQRELKALVGPFSIKLDEKRKPYRWSWRKDAPALSLPALDEPSALLVLLVERHLRAALPPPLERSLSALTDAAKEALSKDGNKLKDWLECVRMTSRFFPLIAPNPDPDIVNAATQALLDKKKLAMTYRGRSDPRRRDLVVNPHGLIIREGTIYLHALEDGAEKPHSFALHRTHSAQVLDARRVDGRKADLDEAEQQIAFLLTPEPVRVTLRFAKEVAHIPVETPVAKNQTLESRHDGSADVIAVVRDTRQFRAWVLGFGAALEVIAPAWLRREMAETAREVAALYGRKRKRRATS